VFVGGQSGEGVLSDSGLSLVGGPNYPVQSKCQSLFRSRSAPTVARGSSSSRTPSPSFPLASLTARTGRRNPAEEIRESRSHGPGTQSSPLRSDPDQPHARSGARGATRRRLHAEVIIHARWPKRLRFFERSERENAQFEICVGEARGVLAGAFQSEREEETRDRAERGSAVRGSDQASVAPKRTPLADPVQRSQKRMSARRTMKKS
jgi:hypothetical protein